MRYFLTSVFLLFYSCSHHTTDSSNSIVSMQLIDRNGFIETISNKERLSSYQPIDFLTPQPYQKVLRVYGRTPSGHSHSKITSYHSNGQAWQYLEVVDGRAHGTYYEWYANGKKRIEATVIEGSADINDLAQTTWLFDGKSTVWDEMENCMAEIYYSKGVLDTPSLYFHPNGQLQKTIPYSKGEIHGVVLRYNEQALLIEEIHYTEGKKQGTSFASWESSQPLYIEEYEKDALLQASYYDSSGKLVADVKDRFGKQAHFEEKALSSLVEIQEGIPNGKVELFSENGTLSSSYSWRDGKKTGEEWKYYPTTPNKELTPKLCIHWHEDFIQGQVKTWYPNGTLESQRELNSNKKQGLSFAWYQNGDLMCMEEYENDLLVKGSYFKRGDKKPVSKIDEGKGLATLYTSEGFLLRKTPYEKGKPTFQEGSLR